MTKRDAKGGSDDGGNPNVMDQPVPDISHVLAAIRDRATGCDIAGKWPAEDLADLGRAGFWRWAVPVEYGGDDTTPLDLHLRYEAVASASLATALILTQRDSAIALIAAADDSPLAPELLPPMARGEIFATIGIAQLTTSRQGGAPALRATPTDTGYRLDGLIPWSTGPAKSQFIIAGAVFQDRQQILFALPTDLPGVSIHPPLPLVALASSWTTQVDCSAVMLDRRWLLRGPVANALAGRKKGVPISQAFLALGLCRGGLDLIATHDSSRAQATHQRLAEQLQPLRDEVIWLCAPGREAEAAAAAPRIRGQCNDLAVRIAHTAVALFKGTALLRRHPAQRLAREAMFLLVWSCPDPVIQCTVDLLAGAGDAEE